MYAHVNVGSHFSHPYGSGLLSTQPAAEQDSLGPMHRFDADGLAPLRYQVHMHPITGEGAIVGDALGLTVGLSVGDTLGEALGALVGANEGNPKQSYRSQSYGSMYVL